MAQVKAAESDEINRKIKILLENFIYHLNKV
jgi:hypothetical protein